jgi:phage tail-like protein
VNIDGIETSFQEVSGLEAEAQVIEYRGGNSKTFSTIKMPGLKKISNVTLKKGIANNDLLGLIAKAKTNTMKRTPVTIKLMDENGEPMMIWMLTNAWITKSVLSDDKSIIEIMEVAHEGLSILNGK